MQPCPACGKETGPTEWKWDPLRWDLDPPCSEAEWAYLADLPQAPSFMATQAYAYMNKICRGCFSFRLEVAAKVRSRIREQGGIEEMRPTQRMRKEYEAAHEFDLVAGRPARLAGLQSVSAAYLNGQFCRLTRLDEQSQRWTVELLNKEQKAIKATNLEVSKEIDTEYDIAKARYLLEQSGASQHGQPTGFAPPPRAPDAAALAGEERRPLGQRTVWPKVRGIHPGAVVRLQLLQAAPELNGRRGRCISFDPDSGRWTVDLGDERKALRIDNLVPAPGERPPTKQSAEEEKKELAAKAERKGALNAKEAFAESYGWDG